MTLQTSRTKLSNLIKTSVVEPSVKIPDALVVANKINPVLEDFVLKLKNQ